MLRKDWFQSLLFPFLVFLSYSLVYSHKLFIAFIFLHQHSIALLQILQTLDNFIKGFCFFVELCYSLNYKSVFLKSFHKGLSQSNVFRVILIYVLGEAAYGFIPLLLKLCSSTNDFHFLLAYL